MGKGHEAFVREVDSRLRPNISIWISFNEAATPSFRVGEINALGSDDARVQLANLFRNIADEIERPTYGEQT